MDMNSPNNTDRTRTRKKKKRNLINDNQFQSQHTSSSSSQSQSYQQQRHSNSTIDRSSNWKSQTQQRIYSTKLLRALRRVAVGPRRVGTVREAADRALAVTAKGSSRWSRAILAGRLKLKFRKTKKRSPIVSPSSARFSTSSSVTGNSRSWKKHRVGVYRLKAKNLPAVQRKAKVLGRLVPGCRRESLPVILEEAKDYIPALEMQIRAMTDLINRLTASASASAPGSAQPQPAT